MTPALSWLLLFLFCAGFAWLGLSLFAAADRVADRDAWVDEVEDYVNGGAR